MPDAGRVRRIVVSAFGGAEQLKFETVAEAPLVAPGELLVDVEASGINYLDVYQRSGRYRLPLPYTPGFEGVGRIRQLGAPESADSRLEFASHGSMCWDRMPARSLSRRLKPFLCQISSQPRRP